MANGLVDAVQTKLAMAVTEQTIISALQSAIDPNTGKGFVSSKCIKALKIDEGVVRFTLELGYPALTFMNPRRCPE